MRLAAYSLLIMFYLGIIGCAGTSPEKITIDNKRDWTFDTVRKLRPGKSSRVETIRILGKPDQKFLVEGDVPGTRDELWIYISGGKLPGQRVAILFESKSETLLGINWNAIETDPESNPKKLLIRFPDFKISENYVDKTNPHAYKKVMSYRSEKEAMTFELNPITKRTTFISFWDPYAKTVKKTRRPKRKPAVWCIANECIKDTRDSL